MKTRLSVILILILALALNCRCQINGQAFPQIRGWNILSDSFKDDTITISASSSYNINHLQLSHDLVMDLKEIRDPERRSLVNGLAARAHASGIKEVVVWDHALYTLKHYPDKFKTGPGGTIDFDNREFWEWFKSDYREMMSLIPSIDGIVLTFIETGARAENQHSARLPGPQEKLAAVVDAVAEVVCSEMGKKLYIRTFAYTEKEYENIIGCIKHIKSRDIILMMKETPHDFFLTHPNDKYAGTINRPTIIEFDCGNEFNGQGVIANTWPEYIIRRWSDHIKRPNVIGYVARTDRYNNTRIVGTPNEILLYALKRFADDQKVTAEIIYDEFITERYGKEALPYIKPAFKLAYDIVTSSLYTLGTNVANHSKLDYDPYKSSYGRHVSGKWTDPPEVYVKHDVERKFHYWKDIIDHIAPAQLKSGEGPLRSEAPKVLLNGWVTAEERMDEEYLKYIEAEKEYGVRCAKAAYESILKGESFSNGDDYDLLVNLFHRTLLTARIHKAAALSYFSYRIYARGKQFQSQYVIQTLNRSLSEILTISPQIESYSSAYPRGQWNWKGDAASAMEYFRLISVSGWKDYGSIRFPYKGIVDQSNISGKSWRSVATQMPAEWYGSQESLIIAENVLAYQRDAGGWPKNTEMHKTLTREEKEQVIADKKLNDAIFDNSATTTEMRFLARMYNNTGIEEYKISFNRGLKFILDAQYDNGGWPMFYPLRKGYYTHITFNDNAIVNILKLLREINSGNSLFSRIALPEYADSAGKSIEKGIHCILKTQITSGGKPTVWCAQHDEITLLPAKARSYELPSYSGAESVGIVLLLMEIDNPSEEIKRSVQGAVDWFDKHRIKNTRWDYFINKDGLKDRRIISDMEAGDLWARFYDLDTGEPFVCDRDGIKKKSLEEIGYERRNGYSWYNDDPKEIFRKFKDWEQKLKTAKSPQTSIVIVKKK